VPHSINDVHIVLIYARTLEVHPNPAIRFKSLGAYQSLYDYCKAAKPKPIAMADKYYNFKNWLDDSEVWLNLGDRIIDEHEPLIAKDAYENYLSRVNLKRAAGQDLSAVISFPIAMRLAKNYASFQSYEQAVKMGEVAFKHDHFHKELRVLLSKWSTIYARSLQKEVKAIIAISNQWKERVWSQSYRRRLKENIVQEMEQKLEQNRLDPTARKELAYYARDQWRSKFLFEEECVIRFQRFFRRKRIMWKRQAAHRQVMLNKAIMAYAEYNRRPRDPVVRKTIRDITNHRFCPRKHVINRVRLLIDEQDRAVNVIRRGFRCYMNKVGLHNAIIRRKREIKNTLFRSARTIQCLVRRKLAYKKWRIAFRRRRQVTKAAKLVQNFIRWRNTTFQHAVTRMIYQIRAKRQHARNTLAFTLTYHMHRYVTRRRRRKEIERILKIKEEERAKKQAIYFRALECGKKILRFVRLVRDVKSRRVAMETYKQRRKVALSSWSTSAVNLCNVDANSAYRNPGISQQSQQFVSCCIQDKVYCSGRSFGPTDALLLSAVLKHRNCSVSRLYLDDNAEVGSPNYEFDLLPAIGKARSLRSVFLFGRVGAERDTKPDDIKESFVTGLIREAQVENLNIKELCIENVTRGSISESIAVAAGRLLCDFLNYSTPGLQTLSLHGCALRDNQAQYLCQGLAVNYSIKNLILSKNMITDDGFNALFKAIQSNKKTAIALLDFSFNHIVCRDKMRKLLDTYISPSLDPLNISLKGNMLLKPYLPDHKKRNRMELLIVGSEVPAVKNEPGSLKVFLKQAKIAGSSTQKVVSATIDAVDVGVAQPEVVRDSKGLIALSSTLITLPSSNVPPVRPLVNKRDTLTPPDPLPPLESDRPLTPPTTTTSKDKLKGERYLAALKAKGGQSLRSNSASKNKRGEAIAETLINDIAVVRSLRNRSSAPSSVSPVGFKAPKTLSEYPSPTSDSNDRYRHLRELSRFKYSG